MADALDLIDALDALEMSETSQEQRDALTDAVWRCLEKIQQEDTKDAA